MTENIGTYISLVARCTAVSEYIDDSEWANVMSNLRDFYSGGGRVTHRPTTRILL